MDNYYETEWVQVSVSQSNTNLGNLMQVRWWVRVLNFFLACTTRKRAFIDDPQIFNELPMVVLLAHQWRPTTFSRLVTIGKLLRDNLGSSVIFWEPWLLAREVTDKSYVIDNFLSFFYKTIHYPHILVHIQGIRNHQQALTCISSCSNTQYLTLLLQASELWRHI